MADRFAIVANYPGSGCRSLLSALPISLWSGIVPLKMGELTVVCSSHGQASGHFIFLDYDICRKQQLSEKYLTKVVARAAKKVSGLGARIIGLEPSTAALLGRSATMIARKFGLTVTGGFGYTVAAAIEGLRKAATLMGCLLEDAEVLILGAAEPFGAVCAQMLARDGANYLTLVDRDSARLDLLSRRLLYDCGVACKLSMQASRTVGRADLIIIAGRGPGLELYPQDLKPGAIVCGLGAADELIRDIREGRPDVMAFDKVVVRLPGETVPGCELGLPDTSSIYSWMAEAVLLALEGRYDRYFLGREMHVEKIVEMRRLSVKHGFTLSGFTAANRYLDLAQVAGIKRRVAAVC